ncbi:MAG: hypothetical protein AB1444_01170 [Spirochaetota bacterium]
MKSNRFAFVLYIVILFSFITTSLYAEWEDLEMGEHDVYGSEKEEKYPVKSLFVEQEKWDNHYSLMVLWLYKYTDYPKYTSYRVLPLYYHLASKIDNRKKTVIFPLLTYVKTNGAEATKYILFPAYYSSISDAGYNKSALLLFWWGLQHNYPDEKQYMDTYFLMIPLLSYYNSYTSEASKYKECVTPLFYYETKSDSNEYTFWAPIIPITYHNSNMAGGHRNILWVLDYSWDPDGINRFWVVPFVMWKKGSDGYLSLLAPLYINNKHANGDYYYHLLPFLAIWKSSNNSYTTKQYITPLFGRRTVTDETSHKTVYKNLMFPVIPVFYYSTGGDSSHTNLMWFIDWKTHKGSLQSLWIAPFIFHKYGQYSYRYYIPFYCRPDITKDEGKSFGIFHYHYWARNTDILWIWPYYHNKQYTGSNDEYAGSTVACYTHILPVYFSWRNAKSQGTLILPLIYNYKDKNTIIHINITGYARKSYTGMFTPDVAMNIGTGKTMYLDTDISWVYEMWSFSSRIPLKKIQNNESDSNLQSQMDEEVVNNPVNDYHGKDPLPITIAKINNKNETDKPQIVKKKTVNREDSLVFWGWKIGFGIMAFEKADSRRHFRLLPLSWLTWDETSADKLFVLLPFYCSYILDDQEYFVLFPLYGYQKKGDSYFKVYALNIYWDEYKEDDYHEKTLLWPFINWYYSPDTKGFRIFPLYWYRMWKENEVSVKRSFSLLHYSKEYVHNDSVIQSVNINPLYYKSTLQGINSYTLFIPLLLTYYNKYEDKEENKSENTLFIAGYYRHRANDYIHDDVLLLYDRQIYFSNSMDIIKKEYSYLFTTIDTQFTPELTKLRLLWGTLFEYDYDKKYNNYDVDALLWLVGAEKDAYGFSHKVLPLYYYYNDNHSRLLIMPVLLSGFYREYDDIFDLGFLGLLYYHNENVRYQDGRRLVLLGILFDEKKEPQRLYHSVGSLWGILWNYEKEQETGFIKFSILKGLYKYVKKDGETKHTFFWFL